MKLIFVLTLLFGSQTFAYLTSDVDAGMGYTSIDLTTGTNKINLNSLTAFDFNYNLNIPKFDTSLNLNFTEVPFSSQGALAWTRIGAGARYYITGFNDQRVIFDNKVEGRFLATSAFYFG